jgi:chitinase
LASTMPLYASAVTEFSKPLLQISKENHIYPSITFKNDTLIIKNTTQKNINLSNAVLKFHYQGTDVSISKNQKVLKVKSEVTEVNNNQPHQQAQVFKANLSNLKLGVLKAGESLSLKVAKDNQNVIDGLSLIQSVLVPVQVKVTVNPADWTQTVNVCNNSGYDIPLTNISFSFNFTGDIFSVWGAPWVDWKVQGREGSTYTLSGGTPWTAPLKSDPTCKTPMTLQFSSSPTTPVPSAPFTMMAEGGHPMGAGNLNVLLSSLDAQNVAAPNITVAGMGTTRQQVMDFGTTWNLTQLIPGSYKVTPPLIDNGMQYYESSPIDVVVNNNMTSMATINYQPVPMSSLSVSLVGAPQTTETLKFTGTKYQLTKTANVSDSFSLPNDSYTISVAEPGYSVSVSPNPVTLPDTSSVTLTFVKQAAKPIYGGYYQSWSSEYKDDGSKTKLANLPSYMNHVYLSFIKPDVSYVKGSLTYTGTGLEFSYANGQVLKDAIATLHQRQPNTKVLLAVGGATYTNWAGLNATAIADFVKDFGMDGVDVDYEPINAGCSVGTDAKVHCLIDNEFQTVVHALRQALPRPYEVTVAAWSIGAYGEDQWKNSQPQGQYTGMMLPLLHSSAADDLDVVNVMSYDAGNSYNPAEALDAYTHYFPRVVSMGVEVPPEAWGGSVYTMTKVNSLADAVLLKSSSTGRIPSMMIWSIQKQPNGTPSDTNPTAQMMSTAICQKLGLSDCSLPLN